MIGGYKQILLSADLHSPIALATDKKQSNSFIQDAGSQSTQPTTFGESHSFIEPSMRPRGIAGEPEQLCAGYVGRDVLVDEGYVGCGFVFLEQRSASGQLIALVVHLSEQQAWNCRDPFGVQELVGGF